MDIWGAGCIQFELFSLYPLFPGLDEADQIHRIHNILGTPKASIVAKLRQHAPPNANFMFPPQCGIGLTKLLPDATESFLDLLRQSVAYDASERISSMQALKHPYFTGNIISFPSGTTKVANNISNDKSRVAKITHEIPPSSYVQSGPTKNAAQVGKESPSESKTDSQRMKQRSMVSMLLARVCVCLGMSLHFTYFDSSHHELRFLHQNTKKVIIEESKARNKTFYRKGGNKNNDIVNNEKASSGIALPKLKAMIPENSFNDDGSYKKPVKYNNLRSFGYGPSLMPPTASTPAPRMRESNPVPMSNGLGSKSTKTKGTKLLPPVRQDFR